MVVKYQSSCVLKPLSGLNSIPCVTPPRSTHDYIEIATLFSTVFISGIEVLNENRNDEARRLVNLIDELYDRQINLVVSAEATPEALYTGSRLSFEFVRAASRLREMQTRDYIAGSYLESPSGMA